ncbi:Tropomyosin alpha-1 chain, putative [Entamoeba invadens IP1]|uniref:Tropomyosin alpha-1 chain, putative n=1 Tax=Entamoeba invadens IP1 TaxID=370355 RepID=A0A0A1TUZ2_ENTIV|nr:Tropomyosin alpha-1 chain, putative [Entamoeba invadens IP1]ELP84100.1 Tropomyosin alpha-1 chain, putative [Entamoeba invadens IP1]|eukprot:XP_004183446.1 Tropomyosin alpha-1 chain, putative [Entamoeba invadens IP1]
MALDDKTEDEKTAADQSDRRKKMEDQSKHSMHKQNADNTDAARKAADSKLQEANDLTVQVDKAQKQLDTAKDDKDGNEAMKQKYQDELKSVRTELDQEKKDHTKTQLIKGKYEKDIAEITVRAVTLEKNVQMAEKEKFKTMRDYKTASEELMRTKTEHNEKQDKCDKLEDDMSEMKTELKALEQAAKTYKQSKNTYEKKLTELNEQLDLERITAQQAKTQKKKYADKIVNIIYCQL